MSKWEQAAVVEDRPKWMDAPEVEPAPGESLADIEARQSETLKAYPGLYDAPWKPADLDAEDKMGEHVESIFHETGRDRGAIIRDMVDLESTPLSPDDRFNAVRGSSLFGLNLSRLAPIPQEDAVAAARHELVAGGPVTTLEKIKQWVRERTGYFEPPIEGPVQRAEHPLGTLAGAGAFYTSSYLSGLGLNIPDILAKPLKGADSLREAVNQTTGFVPTDEEIRAADILDFMGGLKSAGKVAKVVVHRIAARTALRTILQSGVTFAGRDVSKEAARKIITDEPFSLKEIWAQGGIGVLFGIAEVAVATGLDRWTAGKLADEYVRRAPELAQIPRADRIRTAQAALDSHRVTAGEMPMDEWAGKWSEHLQRFSDQLKDLAVRSATTPLQMTGTPAVPAGPAEATPAGLSWMAELRQRARAGEPLLPGEISFLKELGIDPAKEAADALEDQTKAQTALALRSGQGTGASAVAAGVQAPAPGAAAVAAGAEEAVRAEPADTEKLKRLFQNMTPEQLVQRMEELARERHSIENETINGVEYVRAPKADEVQRLQRIYDETSVIAKILDEATQPIVQSQIQEALTPPVAESVTEKQPWERTKDEWLSDLPTRTEYDEVGWPEGEHYNLNPGYADKTGYKVFIRAAWNHGKDVPIDVLQQFSNEPWAQEALAKLGPTGQVTAQGEAAAQPPAAPALPEATVGEEITIGDPQVSDIDQQQPPGAKSAVQPPAPAEIGPPAAPGAIVGQTGAALTKAIEAKNFDVLKESLLPGNDAARAQFEDETGIELPESIAGTENTVGEFVAGRLSPPTEPRLPGGAQAGGTTLLPDMAAEITSIAKTVVNNPIRLVTAVWESLKRNMVAATTYMRSLGPAGVKTAGELDDITKDVVTKSNTDQADLRLIHKGVSKSNRERLYQAMNERIPLSSLPPWLQERVAAARAVLDRARSVAQKLGMQVTLPSGEKVDIDFTGKAYPQIPNAEGLRFLEEAYTQGKGSSRVFAWAQEQVNDQRYADVDEAIQALVRFRDSRFRGVNGYLERTRVELPIEMVEWDGAKTLPTVLERNWMTVEGVRRWGNDFELLEGRIEKMREDHGSDAAQRVRSYIRTSFGIQSPASRSSQAISNLIRRFQFSTKIALSPLTIGRNMADRLAKGMMASPLATIRASIEYPPFVNAVLPHAQRLEDQMIRHGVVFGHGSLSEGYEAGSFFADLARSPFASSERGNQVFIGLVHYKKLLHDIAILEREHAGSIGRVENAIRTVFGQSAAQATERVGPKIAAKLAAGEEIEQKDIDRFLHEMVRDRAFPMVLSTKPIWYDAHPMMKVLAQFKTWPVRQTAMIWKDVLKYTIRTGDLTRLIGFVVGTLIAGELYNIARDLLYGRKESVALSDDTPQAVLKDLAYGGLWGVVADLTYGMTDWAGGVSLKTAKNVGVTAHNIWEEWTLAPEAVEKLISQEVAPYRQVKELARRLDNGDLSESYGQWRARAYEWKDTKKAPTAFARISNYAEDIVFGKPEYEIGPNTLALDLASRHVVAGDLESAAQYIEIALKNADNPKEALGGVKASRTRRSPMGGIPQKDWPEFLKSLDPEQRTAVQRVQREYMTAYNKAIGIAAKNARIRED